MDRISSSTDPSGAGSDRASVEKRDSRLSSTAIGASLVSGPGSGRAALAGTMPQKAWEANIHPLRARDANPGRWRIAHIYRRVA
ncbi:hypothetical protein GLI01_34070 [Gluconacetobacter liquefaciens]|nr:hypothetical protein AA0522_1948 [Gluconacetobacter liquefaciens NRIC 0522]GEB39372.1 hypothetical protein GLI01_34070 [Gluconacetobacter liquefaciens]